MTNVLSTVQHEPSKIIDIKFVKPKRPTTSIPSVKRTRTQTMCSPPTKEEQNAFIETIKSIYPSSAILNVTTNKIGPRINQSVANQLPPSIIHLKTLEQFKGKTQDEIENESDALLDHLKFSTEQARCLTESTILQSKSLLWFEQRKGRITASIFGAVSKTSLEKPSRSLLDRILQLRPFPNVPALEWGRTNEGVARKAYIMAVTSNHSHLKVTQTGLHLHSSYPFVGASPDGIVECSCCGLGLLEIKCPYSKRDVDVSRLCDPNFYLKATASGLKLDEKHEYYIQVQGQLFVL